MEPLSGELTTLREFRTTDLDDYLGIAGDDRVTTWMAFDSYDRAKAVQNLAGIVQRSAQEAVPTTCWPSPGRTTTT